MKPIKLSICISALGQRLSKLNELLAKLAAQPRYEETETIIILDSGQMPTGGKRNRVLDATHGQYVACIDDDDLVADDYILKIIEAIDANPGVDAILLRGLCTSPGVPDVEFDYRLGGIEGEWIGNTIWRSPGHLCPIRADLAKSVAFPQPSHGEDLAWNTALRPLLKTAARAAVEPIYFYRLDPKKTTPRVQHALRSHVEIFTPQYRLKSGPGSTVGYSQPYREWLNKFIRDHKIQKIVDLGCGDMTVMGNVQLRDCEYLGVDVIQDRIEENRRMFEDHPNMMFACEDLRRFTLDADLIICKDVIQHWATDEIVDWLAHLRASVHRFRFALITNCNYGKTVNQNIKTGGWRAIDLTAPPFSIGERVFSWGDEIGGLKEVVLIKGEA